MREILLGVKWRETNVSDPGSSEQTCDKHVLNISRLSV